MLMTVTVSQYTRNFFVKILELKCLDFDYVGFSLSILIYIRSLLRSNRFQYQLYFRGT